MAPDSPGSPGSTDAPRATVACKRCNREDAPALARAPYPGELGRQIQDNGCADCWVEWQKMEVMVINELRLNFVDPQSLEILAQHARDFFFLPPASAS